MSPLVGGGIVQGNRRSAGVDLCGEFLEDRVVELALDTIGGCLVEVEPDWPGEGDRGSRIVEVEEPELKAYCRLSDSLEGDFEASCLSCCRR